MRKVYVYLGGGLGNQLFEYATGRAMALDANANLVLRKDLFVGDGFGRKYSLDDFRCEGYILEPRMNLVRRVHNFYHRQIKRMGLWRIGNTIVDQKWGVYHPMPRQWLGSVSISGSWQSERYFAHHADQIYADLQLKDDSWVVNDDLAQELISLENSTFLHVRSYKDIPRFKDGSYALPISYYANALKALSAQVKLEKVFVFSDDLSWAMERLRDVAQSLRIALCPVRMDKKLPLQETYSASYLRDFHLMSLCQHGIVADSSFSWWAGWLGEHKMLRAGRIGIRFYPDKPNINDFFPVRWVRVKY